MATGLGGPSKNWDDPPSNGGMMIDGSCSGATLPAYMDPNQEYGPMHILRIQGVNGSKLPEAPFMIRKSIEAFLGSRIEGAFPEARTGSYALKVKNPRHFNRLLVMANLSDGTPVEVIEHPALNQTKCVVSCRDAIKLSDDELLEELSEQGVKGIRRITRREGGGRINTPTMILTIRGTGFPQFIDFGYVRCRTRHYYPAPMQCFNCWAYGHTKTRCLNKQKICGNCSVEHMVAENEKCTEGKFCHNCQSDSHAISDRKCPLWQKENKIQHVKVDRNISYPAARRIVEQNSGPGTYAGAVATGNQNEIEKMNRKIDELIEIIKLRDQRIEQLEATLNERRTSVIDIGVNHAPANEVPSAIKAILEQQAQMFHNAVQTMLRTHIQTQKEVQELKNTVFHPAPANITTKVNTPASVTAPTQENVNIQQQEVIEVNVSSNSSFTTLVEENEATSDVEDPLSRTLTNVDQITDLLDTSSETSSSPDSPNPQLPIGTPRPSVTGNSTRIKENPHGNQSGTPKRPFNKVNSPETTQPNNNALKLQRQLPSTRSSLKKHF